MAHPSPSDEPKTPMWLPAIGAALFLVFGIWWATRVEDKPPPAPETTAATLDAAPEAGDAGPAGSPHR
jgi:hypothetical protein